MPPAPKLRSKWAVKIDGYEQHGRHGKPYADSTKDSLRHIRERWHLYCHDADLGLPKEALARVTMPQLKAFFEWVIENAERTPQQAGTLLQYFRVFKMMYKKDTGRILEREDVEDVNDFVRYHAVGKSKTLHRPKPVLTGANLVRLLHFLYAGDPTIYPSERERVQQGFLILIHAFTGLRPSSTTRSSKGRKKSGGEAADMEEADKELAEIIKLRYRDIELFVSVDDHGRTRFVAQATFSYFKGGDRRPQRKTFSWPDQSDILLCPVTHLIALAIHDEAFDPPPLNDASVLLSLRVPPEEGRLKIPWQSSVLDKAILREADNGQHPRQLTDNVASGRLRVLGERLGSENTVTWYWLRRLVLNAVDGHGSEEVRNQVAGHLDSRTYRNNYQDQRIGLDIASLVRRQESDEALIRKLNEPGLVADPRCNRELPPEAREKITGLPDMVALREKRDRLSQGLRDAYGTTTKAPESDESKAAYHQADGEYRAKMQFHVSRMKSHQRRQYFAQKHATIIAAQLDGTPPSDAEVSECKPPKLSIPERITLAGLIGSEDLRAAPRRAERVAAVQAMALLCSRVETKCQTPVIMSYAVPSAYDSGIEDTKESLPPMECDAFQCLFCLGDDLLLLKDRTRILKNQYELGRHVETHLRKIDKAAKIVCPHPRCKATSTTLNNTQHLKNHAQREHGVRLQTH